MSEQRLSEYAFQAGFDSAAVCRGFLEGHFNLDWSPERPVGTGSGFYIAHVDAFRVGIEVYGRLSSSLSPLPPASEIYPGFFCPLSACHDWLLVGPTEYLPNSFRLEGGRDATPGFARLLTDINGRRQWRLGYTLADLSPGRPMRAHAGYRGAAHFSPGCAALSSQPALQAIQVTD